MKAKPKSNVIDICGRPHSVEEAVALATQAHTLKNPEIAAYVYKLILAKIPDNAEIYNNRGVILYELKRYNEALAAYDAAIALSPGTAEVHYNRGIAMEALKRFEDALTSYDQAVKLKPDYAEAYNNRGVILQEMKRFDEALASYTKATLCNPNYAEPYNNWGNILVFKGDMREAEAMFRKAFALKPTYLNPLFNMVGIRNYKDAGHPDVKAIQGLLASLDPANREREYLHFALGKMFDDCGRYDEAFEHYAKANQILNETVHYNSGKMARITNATIDVFSADFFRQPFPFASMDASPLFIVGMPRSGTTLMASILSNHRAVETAGELAFFAEFALRMRELNDTRLPYPQGVSIIEPATALYLIETYEKRLKRDIGPNTIYIIDKHPLNFRYLGLIAMLFPKARVIHCMRNPMDTALSNYFQRFAPDYEYAFDLKNISHFYLQYQKLMGHWRKVLPLKMLEINYEDSISDIKATVQKALDFLELDWDERCLTPHTNPYPVETASNWQVRQPIYTHSVERWRHYEKHLNDVKEMLQSSH